MNENMNAPAGAPDTNAAFAAGDRLAPNPQLLACRVGNDQVLFDSEQGRYYGLNEVGAAVFELAGAGRSLGEIHQALCDRYEVAPAALWADVIAFSRQSLKLGVLRRLEQSLP